MSARSITQPLSSFMLFAGLIVMSEPARAQSPDVERTASSSAPIIHATGTARVRRTPDHVDVSVGVEAVKPTASAAQESANRIMEAAIAAIRDLKLADAELETGRVDLSPRYARQEDYQTSANIIGYVGVIAVRVRTTDLKAVPGIIDAALKAGCNRVNSVSFGIKEALAAREEAVKLATKAAKRKAEVMAEALDLRLVRVAEARTTAQNSWWEGANRMSNMAQLTGGEEDTEDDEGTIIPGKVEVTVEVSVSFVATEAGA